MQLSAIIFTEDKIAILITLEFSFYLDIFLHFRFIERNIDQMLRYSHDS